MKIATISVTNSGLYQGEIKGINGVIESLTLKETTAEVLMWMSEHEVKEEELTLISPSKQ